jgi:cell division protein FtsL
MNGKFKLTGPFQNICITEMLVTSFLVLLLIAFALGVVFTKHMGRILNSQLQTLHTEKERLNNVWSQLTLEKATWMSDLRVEQVAHGQLNMVMPNKIEMIKP